MLDEVCCGVILQGLKVSCRGTKYACTRPIVAMAVETLASKVWELTWITLVEVSIVLIKTQRIWLETVPTEGKNHVGLGGAYRIGSCSGLERDADCAEYIIFTSGMIVILRLQYDITLPVDQAPSGTLLHAVDTTWSLVGSPQDGLTALYQS